MAKQSSSTTTAADLATSAGSAGKAIVSHEYGELAGAGFDNQTNADISIPFIAVLQAGSPQLKKNDPAYNKDAKEGDLINTVTGELFQDGICFQPVDTEHCFVEWRPRTTGGGFVAKYPHDDPKCKAIVDAATEFGKYKINGTNDLVETFYILGFILREGMSQVSQGEPVMIAFSSTKIKVYKALMTSLRTLKDKPPIFANRIKIVGHDDKNQKGDFKNFKCTPMTGGSYLESLIPGKLNGQLHPLLSAGMELLKASRTGLTKVNYEAQGGPETATEGSTTAAGENIPF